MYIDLYAGAGYARVKGTKKILKGSPILALTVTAASDELWAATVNSGFCTVSDRKPFVIHKK